MRTTNDDGQRQIDDAELEAIRMQVKAALAKERAPARWFDVLVSLAPIPQLLDELATLRDIARDIAAMDDDEFYNRCPHCGEESGYLPVKHLDTCPVTRARRARLRD